MREGARRAALAAGALGAVILGARLWGDPVGEEAVAACEARLAEAHGDGAVEVLERRDDRSPAPTDAMGPSGPAGDTLHDVAIHYADAEGRRRTARCAYVDRAAGGGFDPARLSFEDDAAPS